MMIKVQVVATVAMVLLAGCSSGFGNISAGNGAATEPEEIKAEVLAKTGSSWDGAALPRYPQGSPEVTIVKIKIPPGMKLPVHKHPIISAGVVLSGELTVRTEGNKAIKLKAGDPIVEVVNQWHSGMNEGPGPTEILVFYAGAAKSPLTIYK